jgi:hypothetical protein
VLVNFLRGPRSAPSTAWMRPPSPEHLVKMSNDVILRSMQHRVTYRILESALSRQPQCYKRTIAQSKRRTLP